MALSPICAPAPVLAVVDGTPTTTSADIARFFGKRHGNVMRSVELLTAGLPAEFNRLNFELVDCTDAKGETRPAYRLTRDGFTLLAMGFTGQRALAYKHGRRACGYPCVPFAAGPALADFYRSAGPRNGAGRW